MNRTLIKYELNLFLYVQYVKKRARSSNYRFKQLLK